jgi:hypothetical protein
MFEAHRHQTDIWRANKRSALLLLVLLAVGAAVAPPPPLFECRGGQCVGNDRSGVPKAECEKFCIAPIPSALDSEAEPSPAPPPGPASDWEEDLEDKAKAYIWDEIIIGLLSFCGCGSCVVWYKKKKGQSSSPLFDNLKVPTSEDIRRFV